MRAYGDVIFPRVVDAMREGLSGLRDQPVESERYRDLSNSSEFGVVKRLRDNDVALHENQQMYSCGSLAPKMGKRGGGGGGCSDSKFQKPAEPWEFADGCVHLHAELTAIEAHGQQLARLLVQVSDRYKIHYDLYLKVRRLPFKIIWSKMQLV